MAKRPAPATYEFGDWLIEPQLNRLSHGERHVHLTPRAMDVLTFLLDRPGTVASIDELIDEVWQGRVVEENTVHRQVARIRQALSDDIHAPSYVETVPRRGYRTIAPVRRHEENGATEGAAVSTFLLEPFQSNEAGSILAVDVARGITADLRGWGWQTAADATAAFTVSGTVNVSDHDARFNVSILDPTGVPIWTQQYVYPTGETDARTQEEATQQIAEGLRYEFAKHAAGRALGRHAEDRSAFEWLCLAITERARPRPESGGGQEALQQTTSFLDHALALDDQLWPALVHRAKAYIEEAYAGRADRIEDNARQALALTTRAIALNEDSQFANQVHARALWTAREHERAIAHLLWFTNDHHSAGTLYLLALIQFAAQHTDEAAATLARAEQLGLERNPTALLAGSIAMARGDYADAAEQLDAVVREQPNRGAYCFAIVALTRAGRADDATQALARYREQFPDESLTANLEVMRVLFPNQADAVAEALRAAGGAGSACGGNHSPPHTPLAA